MVVDHVKLDVNSPSPGSCLSLRIQFFAERILAPPLYKKYDLLACARSFAYVSLIKPAAVPNYASSTKLRRGTEWA